MTRIAAIVTRSDADASVTRQGGHQESKIPVCCPDLDHWAMLAGRQESKIPVLLLGVVPRLGLVVHRAPRVPTRLPVARSVTKIASVAVSKKTSHLRNVAEATKAASPEDATVAEVVCLLDEIMDVTAEEVMMEVTETEIEVDAQVANVNTVGISQAHLTESKAAAAILSIEYEKPKTVKVPAFPSHVTLDQWKVQLCKEIQSASGRNSYAPFRWASTAFLDRFP